MCWALNDILLSLVGFLLLKMGTMILFSGTKHLLGTQMFLSRVCVSVRWQYSLTHFGTLSSRQSTPVYLLPVIKTMQVIHLIKLL